MFETRQTTIAQIRGFAEFCLKQALGLNSFPQGQLAQLALGINNGKPGLVITREDNGYIEIEDLSHLQSVRITPVGALDECDQSKTDRDLRLIKSRLASQAETIEIRLSDKPQSLIAVLVKSDNDLDVSFYPVELSRS